MKKQAYQTPETIALSVELQRMMAGSGQMGVFSDEEDGIKDESEVLSRHTNLWDDDEEDF